MTSLSERTDFEALFSGSAPTSLAGRSFLIIDVPEPAAPVGLFGLGLVGMGLMMRKRKTH